MTTLHETFVGLTLALDYPMLIVTTVDQEERAGCLVGFSTQCSIGPPRYLVCLSDKNRTTRVAARAVALAVHFVPEAARDLAELIQLRLVRVLEHDGTLFLRYARAGAAARPGRPSQSIA